MQGTVRTDRFFFLKSYVWSEIWCKFGIIWADLQADTLC